MPPSCTAKFLSKATTAISMGSQAFAGTVVFRQVTPLIDSLELPRVYGVRPCGVTGLVQG